MLGGNIICKITLQYTLVHHIILGLHWINILDRLHLLHIWLLILMLLILLSSGLSHTIKTNWRIINNYFIPILINKRLHRLST